MGDRVFRADWDKEHRPRIELWAHDECRRVADPLGDGYADPYWMDWTAGTAYRVRVCWALINALAGGEAAWALAWALEDAIGDRMVPDGWAMTEGAIRRHLDILTQRPGFRSYRQACLEGRE